SKDVEIVKEIVARIDALDDLMKDLLLYARPPRPRLARVQVGRLVEATAGLLARDPALSEVEVAIEDTAPPVEADAEMLKIVFLNLLVNGAHAMSGRGRIRVSAVAEDGHCR